MNCEIVNNQIDELSLSDLNNICDELTAHLKQCAACKAQYQAHQTYLQRIQAINTPDLQPAVAAIMLRKAKQQGNKTTTKNVRDHRDCAGPLQKFRRNRIRAIVRECVDQFRRLAEVFLGHRLRRNWPRCER